MEKYYIRVTVKDKNGNVISNLSVHVGYLENYVREQLDNQYIIDTIEYA